MSRGEHDDPIRRLIDARDRLERVAASHGSDPSAEVGADGRGSGEAYGGLIRAQVAQGLVTEINLDPQTRDLTPAELGGHVTEAVNAALAAAAGTPGQGVDVDALAGQLAAVEKQAMSTFALITAGLDDAVRRSGPRSGMQGDPEPRGFASLFAATRQELQGLRDLTGPTGTWDGYDPGGEIRTVVGGAGHGVRVESLEIAAAAIDRGTRRLGEQVALAVNTALRAADRDGARPQGAPSDDTLTGGSVERLRAARDLQDLSLEVMESQLGRLAQIMSGIGEPTPVGGIDDEREVGR